MKPVTIIAFPVAPVGAEDELLKQFEKLVPATRAEPGCLAFVVHRHPSIANRFSVYEKFRSQEDFEQHLACDHTREFIRWIEQSGTVLQFESWDEVAFL